LRSGVRIPSNVVERISTDDHFYVLNPIVHTATIQVDGSYVGVFEEDNNIFGVVGASIEESSRALVVGELSLFKRLFVVLVTCDDPLAWWCIHEMQFPNVGFLAKQLFEILGSHIETEHVFNFVGTLITL
jgi:hypothetical protein